MRAITAVLIAAIMAAAGLNPAALGQWTRPAEDHLTITSVSLHRLDSDGGGRDLVKEEAAVYAEYGLTGSVTLIARSAAQMVREAGPAERRTVVIDGVETERLVEPRREFGVGGIELGARLQLHRRGPWALAAQGVFGVAGSGENRINREFGEGGGDTDLRLQLGRSLGGGAFLAASGGWRNRRGEDQDEIRIDLTAGRPLDRGVHVFVQSYSVWSIDDAPDAGRPYSGHRVQASLAAPVSRRARLQIGVLATVSEQNMAREYAALVSLWRRF